MTHTSTEQPELLPCPLCGGDVKHEVWSDRNYHKIECQDCGLDVDCCTPYAELAAFWNRRTPAAQAGRVALSDEQIEALPVWDNFVGLFPSTRLEIAHAIIKATHGITQEKQG